MNNFSKNEQKLFSALGLAHLLDQKPHQAYQKAILTVFSSQVAGPHVDALRRGYRAVFIDNRVQRRTFEFEDLIEFDSERCSEKIRVDVLFRGVVEVCVPLLVPSNRRRALAEKLAICRLLATTDNPDAPEDAACDEYSEVFGLTDEEATFEWNTADVESVTGTWSIDNATTKDSNYE